VEGRYPNLLIAGRVAKVTGQKARHILERGFNKQYYLDAIASLIREHQPIPRSEIDRLLLDKLPEILDEKQKKAKIHSLMAELSPGNGVRLDIFKIVLFLCGLLGLGKGDSWPKA